MPARNTLLLAPPYPVELALTELGANLRTARLRRNLTVEEVAQKIGAGRRAVSDAERGKLTTSVADPARDQEGQVLARSKARIRARRGEALDNDF